MFLQEEIDPTFGGRPMQPSDSARGTSRCCVGHGDLTSTIASLLMLTQHVHTICPLLWAVITGQCVTVHLCPTFRISFSALSHFYASLEAFY
jgi:hypothetical protein